MAVFLSPGVFPREIDLSVLPAGIGALTPAFIGTASKCPVNEPTFVSSAQDAVAQFGEPFPESFLMYAVLAYFEEGNRAWVLRIGVECEEGQDEELADVCIDTSGAREDGWGRISVYSGIAFGQICTRAITSDAPLEFHDADVFNITYTDIDTSSTDGPTTATLSFTGSGLSDAYTGPIDDSFIMVILSDVTGTGTVGGTEYQITRNSDGEIVSEGTLTEKEGVTGESDPVDIGDGLIFAVIVTGSSPIEENDSFTFQVQPDNKEFEFDVDLAAAVSPTTFAFSDGDSYDNPSDFADDFNAIIGSGEDYLAIARDDDTACITTRTAGESIQLQGSEAFSLEIGQSQYAFDIPRSFLIGTQAEPYNITTSNNRVNIDVISTTETTEIEFSVGTGLSLSAAVVASSVDAGGTFLGVNYWNSFVLTVPGGDDLVVIETTAAHEFSQLKMQADASHIKTLRFAQELGILFPFTKNVEAFNDPRVALPDVGTITPSSPLSCELDPTSDECAADSAYFQNIVGWFVAKSPGTWIDNFTLNLVVNIPGEGLGDVAGRFDISIFDLNGNEEDAVRDVTFDPTDERYVGNVINEGSSIGGTNGNFFIQWIARPTFLNNDPINDPDDFEVRVPMPIFGREFAGEANGIPTDPAFSSELDRATIGNPALETGIFAFQNPEVFDISLLVIPGVSSGSVIGAALQMVENRGDVLYLVDPPFGLRPQQVVDWHNGMLFSDLSQAINSSFGALYYPHLKIFDQFNNTEIFVPPSGHVSSVFARTAEVSETWFAPAGLRRGRLLTPLDTEVDLTQGERDLLYGFGNAVNPIVNFVRDGITVFGQRTLQRRSSALDRVNVRMLLIFIRKNAVELLRDFIFEPNDRVTRASVKSILDSFLADIQGRRGLTGFNTIVDERNNTPERIDRNELHVSVFLKPTRAIEFIVLNLVILRTEQSFAAEEVLAAGGIVSPATL